MLRTEVTEGIFAKWCIPGWQRCTKNGVNNMKNLHSQSAILLYVICLFVFAINIFATEVLFAFKCELLRANHVLIRSLPMEMGEKVGC